MYSLSRKKNNNEKKREHRVRLTNLSPNCAYRCTGYSMNKQSRMHGRPPPSCTCVFFFFFFFLISHLGEQSLPQRSHRPLRVHQTLPPFEQPPVARGPSIHTRTITRALPRLFFIVHNQ